MHMFHELFYRHKHASFLNVSPTTMLDIYLVFLAFLRCFTTSTRGKYT
mgnify:CR=1 FL=1